MAFQKRKQFSSTLNDVALGITSRTGGTTKVTIPQVRWDGKELDKEAASEQEFVLESTGKNVLKVRGAFHKETPFCIYEPNTPTDKVTTRQMPLPMVPLNTFEDQKAIPAEIRAKMKGNKIPDYTHLKKDENGKIVSEAVFENGSWFKKEHGVPVYKQYFDEKGDPYTDEKADGSDAKGPYIETTSKFCYQSLCDLGFFGGHEIDSNGKEVKDTKGVYMVEGEIGEDNFIRLYPMRSGGKLSIGSRLARVFNNPLFGNVKTGDIVKGKLKEGKFSYSPKPVNIAIYNGDGNVAAKLIRPCYKLEEFRPKQERMKKVDMDALGVVEDEDVDDVEDNNAVDDLANLL